MAERIPQEPRVLSRGWSVCWLGLIALGFFAYAFLLGAFDWGMAAARAGMLLLALPICWFLWRRYRRPSFIVANSPAHPFAFLTVGCLLLVWQLFYFLDQYPNPRLIDVATTTLKAGQSIVAGNNPYTLPLDPRPESQQGGRSFDGYKYGPAMALLYFPLSSVLELQGILITNFVLQLLVAGLVAALATRIAGPTAGLFAFLLYMSIPFVPGELFQQGITDLAAVAPLLAACLIVDRWPLITGLLVGLSISIKPLPGSLFVILCLPAKGRAQYLLGLAVGLLPLALATAFAPSAVFSNLVVFNMIRPPDSTSWLETVPKEIGLLARFVFGGVMLAALALIWRRPPELFARLSICVVCSVFLLLSSSICHRNYLLWWLPLLAVLLASAALPSAATEAAPSSVRDSTESPPKLSRKRRKNNS
jgi:hypothetical protein